MYSNMSRRILAMILAVALCFSAFFTGSITVKASEFVDSNIDEISENVKNETSLKADDEIAVYRFVPQKTGIYHFYSVESGDTYGVIYDESGNKLKEAFDDGDSGVDFSMELELTAGAAYYLGVDYYLDTDEGTIIWYVECLEQKENEIAESKNENLTSLENETNAEADESAAADMESEDEAGDAEWFLTLNEAGDGLIVEGNSDNEITILNIPERLSYDGQEYPVTEIGSYAFNWRPDLSEVNIPETVTKIGEYAFADTNLTHVALPESVTEIGTNAFRPYDGATVLYMYGKNGSAAESYCQDMYGWNVIFRDLDGVYLSKATDETIELRDRTMKLSIEWPKDDMSNITWSSSNDAVASVDETGTVTWKKKGLATITVTRGEYSDFVTIRTKDLAETSEDGKWKYTKLSDTTAAICGYTGGTESRVTIPDAVDGYTVTRLGRFCVNEWDGVKAIVLPTTVQTIEARALIDFYPGNGYGEEIIIPENNSLKIIGDWGLGWTPVYGPKDFALKNSCGVYYLDKEIRFAGSVLGSVSSDGLETANISVMHIPSDVAESDTLEWSVSDPEVAFVESGSREMVTVCGLKAGTVTITAEIGSYSKSMKWKFNGSYMTSSDGTYAYYMLEDGSVAIENYLGESEDCIVIPDIIDGHAVSQINSYAFSNCAAYVIPDSIAVIQDNAFSIYGMNKLVGASDAVRRYVKRWSDSATLYSPDQIVLNTEKENLWINSETGDGYTGQLIPIYIPEDLSSEEVRWTSSDPDIVSVDEFGNMQAIKQGNAQITVTIGSRTVSCEVEVGMESAEGYRYCDLSDGTVEILDTPQYAADAIIPEQIDGKAVSVIGALEINLEYCWDKVEIPDTVHTIRTNAFWWSYTYRSQEIMIPASVTTIEEGAFAGDGSYVLYGTKESVTEEYVREHDNFEFKELTLLLSLEEMYVGIGETAELYISYFPDGTTAEDQIRWESSDEEVVRLEAGETNDAVMCVPLQAGESVITCTVGDYEASVNVIVYSNGFEVEPLISGDYSYYVNADGTIRILEYLGDDTKVTVPEQIDGKDVVSVSGFGSNAKIEEVKLPVTVTEIAYNAFLNCVSLSSVNISDLSNLESIGDNAFAYTSITEAIIPDSVSEMGHTVFRGCGSLTDVKLGSGIDGIPYAEFMGCSGLKNIELPANITYIESAAFSGSGLNSILIPDSVTSIGDYAFEGCESLSMIKVGNKVAFIGESAFADCNADTLELGGNELCVSSLAYINNHSLTKLTLKEGVTRLQYRAFYGCENLESISFPSSLKKIEWGVFDDTKWMENHEDGPVYIDDILYTYKGTVERDQTVVVKSGTKYIEEHAFDSQKNMTDIVLPSTLTTIREYAFNNCDSLEKISIPSSVKTIEPRALGYHSWWYKDLNLVICGVAGSAAESYAKENGFDFEELEIDPIPMTGITLSDQSIALREKGQKTLTVSFEPADTTDNKEITWSSSNDQIATVDENGKVTAVSEGTAVITAAVGTFEKECEVTVTHDFGEWIIVREPSTKEAGLEQRTCMACGKVESRELPKIAGEWKKDSTGWWYQYSDGTYAKNEVVEIDEILYAFNASGYIATGWYKDAEGAYYYSTTSGLKTGWQMIDGIWYYMDPVTGKRITDLQSTSISLKEKEIFELSITENAMGANLVSWSSSDASVAAVDKDGKVTAVSEGTATITVKVGMEMRLCAVKVSHDFGKWVTVKPASTKEAGIEQRTCAACGTVEKRELPKISGTWKKDSVGWWYAYANGSYPKNEVVEIDGILYAFNASGYIASGWYKDAEGVYYYSTTSGLKTGWQMIGGIWYYMDPATGKLIVELQRVSTSLKENESVTIGKTYLAEADVMWTSNDEKVVIADQSGKITAESTGSATITVTAGNVSKECSVIVSHNYGNWETVTPATKEEEGLQKRTCIACGYEEQNPIPKITGVWKKDSTGWWYSYSDGTYAKNEIVKIDGTLYAFNAKGYIAVGWYKDGEGEYYYSTTSGLKSGWLKVSGKWYYMDKIDYKAYKNEWLNDTYYFLGNNAMATGWTLIGDDWYYFSSSGSKEVNKWISGVYYLKSDGKMAVDEWVDGDKYYVDASGKWVPGKQKTN